MSIKTTNCKECRTLVYETDIPSKKSGLCWRCELDRLKNVQHAEKSMRATNDMLLAEIESLKKDKSSLQQQLNAQTYKLFETCNRLQFIVMYNGEPEVKAAIDAFLGDHEDGMDWLNPPPEVDENLEKLENFKESLKRMFPELSHD